MAPETARNHDGTTTERLFFGETEMAEIRYGPIVRDVLGSIEGVTFTETAQGPAAKARTSRAAGLSAAKLAAQAAAVIVAKSWNALTDAERAGWTALGQTLVRSTRIGRKYRPTGYATYLALNQNLQNAGAPINATAPSFVEPPPLNTVQVIPTYVGAKPVSLTAAWNQLTPVSTAVVIEATPPYGFGFEPDSHRLQRLTTIAPSAPASADITTAWTNVYGDMPSATGYKVLFRFYTLDTTTGFTGCPLDFVLADRSTTPIPAAPTTTTPTTTTAATQNQLYVTTGDTANPAYLYLDLEENQTYTLTFNATNSSGTPQLLSGPSTSSLSVAHDFAQADTVTLTAAPGQLYFLATTAWPPTSLWTALLQLSLNTQPPEVTAITPSTGPVAGGTTVTITGENFTRRDLVYFGETPAIQSWTIDSTTIKATSPPSSGGTVDITVHNATGCSATSPADHFTYTPCTAPTVTSVAPNNGTTTGGTPVLITGTNFTFATAVNFGTTPATSFTITSATTINAVSPPGTAGTVDVTVESGCGTSPTSSADEFTYTTAPTTPPTASGWSGGAWSTPNISFSVGPTPGANMIVFAYISATATPATPPSPAWQYLGNVTFSGLVTTTLHVWYLPNWNSSTLSTYTFTGAGGGGGFVFGTINGSNATTPIDQTASNTGGPASSGTSGTTPPTTSPNELCVCFAAFTTISTNGYAQPITAPDMCAYTLTVSSTGTQQCDFTTPGSVQFGAILLTIQP